MLQSASDVTSGQSFSVRVEESKDPQTGAPVFKASTKNAPELGEATASTSQGAMRAFSDRLARYVAGGYKAKR